MDGKKADFAEGMFGSTRRYLAYTRKVPSALRVSSHHQGREFKIANSLSLSLPPSPSLSLPSHTGSNSDS